VDDEMPIPSDLVAEVMNQVIAMIRANGAEDKPNDNNDNKQTVS
jgi:hypothetical protein